MADFHGQILEGFDTMAVKVFWIEFFLCDAVLYICYQQVSLFPHLIFGLVVTSILSLNTIILVFQIDLNSNFLALAHLIHRQHILGFVDICDPVEGILY